MGLQIRREAVSERIQETGAQARRWLIHLRREPFSVAFTLLQPVILLVFMGGAFEALARDFGGGNYRVYLLAGVLGLTVFGNSMAGGISLLFDKENGFLSRLLSTPISRTSVLVGRFLAVNLATILQSLLMLLLGLLFGIQIVAGLGGWVAILMLGLLLGFGVTLISLVLAFVVDSHGDFFAIVGISALPLTFLSSAFVPVEMLPFWMKVVAWANPMTYTVDAMRSLILRGWDISVLARSGAVLIVFDAAVLWIARDVFRRHLA